MERQLFKLQEGEKIVKEIKPLSGLKWYFFFGGNGLPIVLIGVFSILIPLSMLQKTFDVLTVILPVSFLIIVMIDYIVSSSMYNKQHYWITNKRVLYKRGFLGYRITSIPYERISDLIISRTFFEGLFGFGSLHVQTLAGQMSGTGRRGIGLGSEGVFLAIPSPEETQELIFKLVKEKRKDERLSF